MHSLQTVSRIYPIWPYVQIARIDHWFKNVFMLFGAFLAFFYEPALFMWTNVPQLALAFLVTCLIASSNYVLNEFLDAPNDRFHPVKKHRPVPSGMVQSPFALLEWLLLGTVGIAAACLVNPYFAATGLVFWILGVTYNIPPVRTKEFPYLDVLSESMNNPIRLLLGWFAFVVDKMPPLSLVLAYWLGGAFFMALKRFAEYRSIDNRETAAQYRKSFGYYTEERLLASSFFYATGCAFFTGIFLVRYHLELILFVPIAAGFFTYYLWLGLRKNSPVQNPEKLYKERSFVLYVVLSMMLFGLLMFTRIPVLYNLFNVEPSQIDVLWTLGPGARQ